MTTNEPKWTGPVVDYGPLVVFFAVYLIWGLIPATGALMGATLIALVVSWTVRRTIPMMAVVTAVIVGVFGGLTLWFNDETFIKVKPTIVQALFAVILLGGLLFKKPMLKYVLGKVWPIDDAGFFKLSFRFGLFFCSDGGAERGGLAHPGHRYVGAVQGVGPDGPDLCLCDEPDQSVRDPPPARPRAHRTWRRLTHGHSRAAKGQGAARHPVYAAGGAVLLQPERVG